MSATPSESTPLPLESAEGLRLVVPGRVLPAGAGWNWIVEGWRLFVKAPVMWIASIVILFIVAFALGLVPFIGQLAFQMLSPVFAAGFMVACRSLETGGEFELEHLFAGFKTRFGSLVVVGLLTLLGWIAIFLVFAAFAGFSLVTAFLAGNEESLFNTVAASWLTILLGLLVALALAVPLVAAYWFAPPLVILHGVSPLEAMKASFSASFRNFVPFLVYGIVMMLLAIAAVIPFGLGFLVWVPLAVTSTYAAYRDIFTEPDSAA
jgi:uncharacterized membrane protein